MTPINFFRVSDKWKALQKWEIKKVTALKYSHGILKEI